MLRGLLLTSTANVPGCLPVPVMLTKLTMLGDAIITGDHGHQFDECKLPFTHLLVVHDMQPGYCSCNTTVRQ